MGPWLVFAPLILSVRFIKALGSRESIKSLHFRSVTV